MHLRVLNQICVRLPGVSLRLLLLLLNLLMLEQSIPRFPSLGIRWLWMGIQPKSSGNGRRRLFFPVVVRKNPLLTRTKESISRTWEYWLVLQLIHINYHIGIEELWRLKGCHWCVFVAIFRIWGIQRGIINIWWQFDLYYVVIRFFPLSPNSENWKRQFILSTAYKHHKFIGSN